MGMCDLCPSGDVPCSMKCDFCKDAEAYGKALEKTIKEMTMEIKILKIVVKG